MINIPKTQWQPLPGMLPIKIQRDWKGVNKLDSFSIGDEYSSDQSNLTTDNYPFMSVRQGFTALGTAIDTDVLGLGVWKDTELHGVFSDGTWRKWTGSAWSSALKSSLNTSAKWTFTNFKGNLTGISLFGTNGTDGLFYYDGSTVSSAVADAPSGLNYITTYQNRIWGAVGNTIYACYLDKSSDWSTFNGDDADAYYKVVESPDGESISAIKSGLSKMVIGTPNSLWQLFGGVPSDFQTLPVTFDLGIADNQSADTLDGVLTLLNHESISQFAGGTSPDKSFSTVVQYYNDNVNSLTNALVASDGHKIYVSLPMSGTSPDTLLMYDSRADLQAWSPWDLDVTCFARMGEDFYFGNTSGLVCKLGGNDDNGTAIDWHWISRMFTSQSLAQKIRMYHLWVTVDLPTGSTMNAYLSSVESDTWTLVKAITATNDLSSTRLEIPVTTAENANWVRIKLSGTGQATIREIAWQLRELPL